MVASRVAQWQQGWRGSRPTPNKLFLSKLRPDGPAVTAADVQFCFRIGRAAASTDTRRLSQQSAMGISLLLRDTV
jgi:hypothetical protein